MSNNKDKKILNVPDPSSSIKGSGDVPKTSIREDLLESEYWLAKELWTEYEIPFLFLGYKPQYRDIYLNAQEVALREQYAELIREAIELKKLIPHDNRYDHRGNGLAFLSHDVKAWRKTKPFINPAQNYLDMEKIISEIQAVETDEQAREQNVDQSIPHSETTQSDNGLSKREIQKITTKERNSSIQTKADEIAKFKIDNEETFTLQTIAKEIYESGEFKNVSIDTIKRCIKKTWQ